MEMYAKRRKTQAEMALPRYLQETSTLQIDSQLKADNTEKLDQYLMIKQNQQRFNDYVRDERKKREYGQKVSETMKRTSRMPAQTMEEVEADPDLGMNEFGLKEPHLGLPEQVDQLYVEKPIDKYEPNHQKLQRKRLHQEPDENKIIRKKFKSEPTTQAELRDCSEELTGDQLQRISAGPQTIAFGSVFQKSITTKSFLVTNDLRQHIHVRLVFESPELEKSTPHSQVIPPGQDAGFDIVFCSQKVQKFKGVVTYFINEVHSFRFLVTAQADPVVLELQKNQLKFTFPEESMEMSVSETFVVTNNGNDRARFKWQTSGSGVFVPNPVEDAVEAGQSKMVRVTFTPNGPKTEEEVLVMKIEDGINMNVRCSGHVAESRCAFLEKALDFGFVPVGLRTKEEFLHIKNHLRTPCVFHVLCDSEELQISPMVL